MLCRMIFQVSGSSGSVDSIPASAAAAVGGFEDGLDRDAAFFLGLIIFGAVVFVAAVATVLFRVSTFNFSSEDLLGCPLHLNGF